MFLTANHGSNSTNLSQIQGALAELPRQPVQVQAYHQAHRIKTGQDKTKALTSRWVVSANKA